MKKLTTKELEEVAYDIYLSKCEKRGTKPHASINHLNSRSRAMYLDLAEKAYSEAKKKAAWTQGGCLMSILAGLLFWALVATALIVLL